MGIFTALTALIPAGIGGALFLFVSVRFLLGAATDKKGNDIDLTFDHTTLSLGGNTPVKLE